MRDSRLRLSDDIRDRVVSGTSCFGSIRRFDLVEPKAAASLYATAADYAKLVAALLADPWLLSLTVSLPVPTEPELGLA